MEKKCIPILLMGCGGVGRQLVEHVVACRSLHSKQGLAMRVVGVSDSRSLLSTTDVSATELTDAFLMDICRAKSSGSSLSSLNGPGHCRIFEGQEARKRVIEIAGLLSGSTGLVIVDCSATVETVEILKQAIDLGCCIVLANKKPLTCGIEDYKKLTLCPRRIRYESTVGAGLPVIASVTRVLESGDPIYRIIGSLSGTLGYVMSEVEDGKLLSQVVQAAKRLGYTEPESERKIRDMRLWVCKALVDCFSWSDPTVQLSLEFDPTNH